MTLPDINPVLLELGPLAIRWYALAYVAGILFGWRYAVYLAKSTTVWGPKGSPATEAHVDDLILWLTLGVILGGRIGYVVFYQPALIWTDPLGILRLWEGGMAFHGGLIGVALAIVLFARQHKISVLSLGDLIAPVVPAGLFLGRIANFINGELWGRPTDAPWGVVFCNKYILQALGACPAGEMPRHPSQLYEAALEGLVLFAVLWFGVHKARWLERPGLVTGVFLFGYGLSRALLETVRNPDLHMPDFPLGLTMGMMLSIPMILAGAWLIWSAQKNTTPAAPTA